MALAWFVVVLLVAVNAFYVAAEFATVSVRRSRIAQLAEEGSQLAQRLLPRIDDSATLDRYIAACQIGITWSSVVLGAYSQATLAPAYAALLEQWIGLNAITALSTASLAVLLVMTVFQVVAGELVPKSAALVYPTQIALALVIPMEISIRVYSWFLALLNGSGLAILRLLGVGHVSHQHIHSPEEIEFLMGESRRGGLLETSEHQRLGRALRLASRPVRDLMVPGRFMVRISIDAPAGEVVNTAVANNYTRLPVYRDSPDNIVGILHTKDLVAGLARTGSIPKVSEIMRPLVAISEFAAAGQLLDVLSQRRAHQAIVAGEHGIVGLVAFGDLMAELLGRIGGKGRFGQPAPARLPDGRVRLPGFMRVDEAADWIAIESSGRAATIGGLILQALGRLPAAGERIAIGDAEFEVEQVGHHSISSVLVRAPAPERDGG
ncbi:MAG: hemolysin family protein [Bryobacteraceae bacterium]